MPLPEADPLLSSAGRRQSSSLSCTGCTGCGTRTATSWAISDGSAYWTYSANADCEWIFIASDSTKRTKISFSSIGIDSGDYLRIYDCSTNDCSSKTQTTAVTNREYTNVYVDGSTRVMMVTFTSDGSFEGAGFDATFTQEASAATPAPTPAPPTPSPTPAPTPSPTPAPGCSGCTGCGTQTSTSWQISDGSGSGNYPNNADCDWIFIASDTSATAKITFSTVDVENRWDYVRVYDCSTSDCSSKTEIREITGTGLTNVVVTGTTRVMMVTFTSDGSVTRAGFDGTFTQVAATPSPTPRKFAPRFPRLCRSPDACPGACSHTT